jgi:hypothetical protein
MTSISTDEEVVLTAFARSPLDRGMHPTPGIIRAMGGDATNPTRCAVVEGTLRRLAQSGRLRRITGPDGVSYYMRQQAGAGSRLFGGAAVPTR